LTAQAGLGILYTMAEVIKGEVIHEEHNKVAHVNHNAPHKQSFFKKKGFLIALVVVLVLLLGGGGFYFISSKNKAPAQDEQADQSDQVLTLSPEEIGLTVEPKSDKKAVKIKIEKAGDIKSIEYQVTYEADSTAEEKAEGGDPRVQRGITGDADVKDSSYESDWLDLGSCSRNVCRYDTGVEKVDVTLKIVKKNGKTYEVQKSVDLNS
jgi:flagellar basal body-associated protein FliL